MKRGILRTAIEFTAIIPVVIKLRGRSVTSVEPTGPPACYLDTAGIAGVPAELDDIAARRLVKAVLGTTETMEIARRAARVAESIQWARDDPKPTD